MKRQALHLAVLAAMLAPPSAFAGAFVFAIEGNPDEVTHPRGYTGTGGALAPISICIDTSVEGAVAAQAEGAVIKAVTTYNRMRSVAGNNLALGVDTDLADGQVDFESTVLHEMGHCLGLDHPNHASESGIAEPGRNGTKSMRGPNGVFDQNAGVDTRHGSSDDVRVDDVNLHWYVRNQNNPAVLPAVFDTSTMARALTDLPNGHLFAANADRNVMAALGFPGTEAVLQQGATFREVQRILQHDDAATLRFARAGLDRIQGNADDYSYRLQYVGRLNNPSSADCNLRVRFSSTTSFAFCDVARVSIDANNVRVTTANMSFASGVNWLFSNSANTITEIVSDGPDPSVPGQTYAVQVRVTEAAGISIAGEPRGTVEVTDGLGGLCTITLAGTPGEIGSCNLATATSGTATLTALFLGFGGFDASETTTAHTVAAPGTLFINGFE